MKPPLCVFAFAGLLVSAFAQPPPPPRDEWYRGLSLEKPASEAELILAGRVEEVTEIRLVAGGKGESTTLQFKFKPTRILKGVFARPELILGSGDLVGYQFSGDLKSIKAGETRLLFLGRSGVGYRGMEWSAGRPLDHLIPPLAGENDPLLQSVVALLAVHAEPDRIKRVALLTDALAKSSGPAAIPLLAAMHSRALLAAQHAEATPAITRHLADASPAVRFAAASALKTVLAADYLEHPELRDQAAAALAKALAAEGSLVATRVALIDAVGELGSIKDPVLLSRLDFTTPARSVAENTAQVKAVGKLRLAAFGDKLVAHCTSLPIDSPGDYETERALARVNPAGGVAELARRAGEKLASGFACDSELAAATNLPDAEAASALTSLAALPLSTVERGLLHFYAIDRFRSATDERLVAPLAKLLEPNQANANQFTTDDLLRLGTLSAAQALRPRLAEEQSLERKLRIAELLGKHGMRDGFAYALEHVSEPALTDQAVAALAAINDPRTVEEARKILETSNDVGWNRAAIRILGALGAKEFAPKFLALAADWKNPTAPAALIALADLGEGQALPRIRDALAARSDAVAIAGAQAARRVLARPEFQGDEISVQLGAVLSDTGASQPVRVAAFEALLTLDDARSGPALAAAVTDAQLEGPDFLNATDLLNRIERALQKRKIKLP